MPRLNKDEVVKREEAMREIFRHDPSLSQQKANAIFKQRFGTMMRAKRVYAIRDEVQQETRGRQPITAAGRKPGGKPTKAGKGKAPAKAPKAKAPAKAKPKAKPAAKKPAAKKPAAKKTQRSTSNVRPLTFAGRKPPMTIRVGDNEAVVIAVVSK